LACTETGFIFEKVNLIQSCTANLQSVSFTFALPQEAYISWFCRILSKKTNGWPYLKQRSWDFCGSESRGCLPL